MSRRPRLLLALVVAVLWQSGCKPQQPFYFFNDGDLSHYMDVATDVDYPDVDQPTLGDVENAKRPFSLENRDPKEQWDLRLEEAVQIALANSKVMKSIGGQIQGPPDFIARNPSLVPTIYDPAVAESDPRGGVEAALSAFDAQMNFSNTWQKFTEPRNSNFSQFFPSVRQDDQGTFQWQLSKLNATGGQTSISHSWVYLDSNSPTRAYASDWTTTLKAEFRQPLLQGAGLQFNRIAGPSNTPGVYNGVLLARINTDIALCDFEQGVRNLVSDVEIAYWEVYYAYHQLDAVIAGRDSGLQSWRETNVKLETGTAASHEEAQARNQYFIFRAAVERALTALYQAEAKLRYTLGLSTSDGRLIRPIDEPTTAKVVFDWEEIHAESIARTSELREYRWMIKARELELIASKNFLLPRLDLVGNYQWIGLGQDLIESNGGSGDFTQPGSNAFQSMTSGDFADWTLGVELNMPLGFRRELSGVRNAQLRLARERARLQEAELEVSHQLGFALRELESSLVLTQTNFNRRIAARDEVRSAKERFAAGTAEGTLTNLLDAERRLAEAESDYYRSLIDYNKAIAQVHYRKGSLLEYNGVYLAEGPWPAKAYFDATRQARKRDSSVYLDYGFTAPGVISRGAIDQEAAGAACALPNHGEPTLAPPPADAGPHIAPPGEPAETDILAPPPAPKKNDSAQATAPERTVVAKGWTPKGSANRYDLGNLDLSGLATKADKPSAEIQPASYTAPTATAVVSGKMRWSDPRTAAGSTAHDPAAPSPEADKPNQKLDTEIGWKMKQR